MTDSLLDPAARRDRFDALHRDSPEPPWLAGALLDENRRLLRALIPEGASVLDLGCGDGRMLASLRPSRGVGVDLSPVAIDRARALHAARPELEFHAADAESPLPFDETFDVVLLNLAVGDFLDVWKVFRSMRRHCTPGARVIFTYYNFLWYPAISLATALGLRRPSPPQNWLSLHDLEGLLRLNGFETISTGTRLLCPLPIPLLAPLCNRLLAKLPGVGHLNVLTYGVARLAAGEFEREAKPITVSIVIPTRNERGNIEGAVTRTPDLGARTELIFVDGQSNDGTVEEIEAWIERERGRRDIRLIHQVPREAASDANAATGKMLKLGKGDAVRKGFAAATGDVLMILDSDLTVPPEDMEKFYAAIAEGRAEFVNGNRLSYPMERQAMRFLNLLGNRFFGILFTWLLDQPVKDTLCGTKVLSRASYEEIARGRAFFGDFDPFGDFDLLFGAARRNLKIVDLPVRYRARVYGEIKIERVKHFLLLLRMCWFAFKRLKLQ